MPGLFFDAYYFAVTVVIGKKYETNLQSINRLQNVENCYQIINTGSLRPLYWVLRAGNMRYPMDDTYNVNSQDSKALSNDIKR